MHYILSFIFNLLFHPLSFTLLFRFLFKFIHLRLYKIISSVFLKLKFMNVSFGRTAFVLISVTVDHSRMIGSRIECRIGKVGKYFHQLAKLLCRRREVEWPGTLELECADPAQRTLNQSVGRSLDICVCFLGKVL